MTYAGIINIFKPPGMTSHDVVSKIRKILKTKKVGHTGTLDPDAVGVLPICIGKATRLAEYLTSDEKTYRAILTFGSETDTQDSSGKVVKETSLPEISIEQFSQILNSFLGEIEQIPPMYSAIKIQGQPLYKLARQGQEVPRKARTIYIHDLKLLEFDRKKALLEITCSKGTYIRSLCEDIARACNSSGHMSFLIRTKSGNFSIDEAFTLEEVASTPLEEIFIRPADALNFPQVITNEVTEKIVRNGNKLSLNLIDTQIMEDQKYKVVTKEGELLAVASLKKDYLQPEKVLG
ncbi:MAG: tRNA pseudouridine(55) synthase TruB [Clostridia bacterium]|nr:tRNA pseudouridine(55) synthase TruB [Clostridia bacterium]